jgi:extracellular factor (EF) 3-hydroxypalmitic acid methyl ester biosynthesis protein
MSSQPLDFSSAESLHHLPHPAGSLRIPLDELFVGFLNDIHQRLLAAHEHRDVVHRALNELFLGLRARRLNSALDEWLECVQVCRRHPLMKLLHQDPFTYRAFSKPRGYAGDALMMDYIYGREEGYPLPEATRLGQLIFDFTTSAPASEGVRARRAHVAEMIDRLAERVARPQVMAIASGHLREAELSSAVRRGRMERLVALDADAMSLAEVDRAYGRHGVITVPAKFRALLTGKLDLDRFHLVYSTGLFDYLEQPVAQRLVSTMFQLLLPRGRLMVANFLPGVRDVGYMETYMDWRLVYRTRQDMADLTAEIPEAEIRDVRIFSEDQRNIVFLEVRKR